ARRHPGPEVHGDQHRREAGRGAEIGLLGHEQERHHHDQQRRRPPAQFLQVQARVVEEACEHERGRELGDLGRLELERAELDPALGTQALDADGEHGHERNERDAVEWPRDGVVKAVMDRRDHPRDPHRGAEPHELLGPQPLVRPGHRRGAVDRGEPDSDQAHGGEGERPVERRKLEAHQSAPVSVVSAAGSITCRPREATTAVSGANSRFSSAPAIGAAMSLPWPLFSDTIDIAIVGASSGAKHTNSAWSLPCGFWAVPVFPATFMPGTDRDAFAVPPGMVTLCMARCTVSQFARSVTTPDSTGFSILKLPWPSTDCTTCGRTGRPSFATTAVIVASWIGVTSSSPWPMPRFRSTPLGQRPVWKWTL